MAWSTVRQYSTPGRDRGVGACLWTERLRSCFSQLRSEILPSTWYVFHQKRMKRMHLLAVWQPLIANFIRGYGNRLQEELGGPTGHACDLMGLDSNSMTHQDGSLLPHFTPHLSPQSCGDNFFAQYLSSGVPFLEYPYMSFRLFLWWVLTCLFWDSTGGRARS